MRGDADEAGGVERGAHLGRRAAVEAGELDLVRARLRELRQRPLEVGLEAVAQRVELDGELHRAPETTAAGRTDPASRA